MLYAKRFRMKCPECNKQIELTWRRYLSAPFSRFHCPSCSTKFKFKRPLWYWLLPIMQCAVILLGGIGIINYMVGNPSLGHYAKPAVVILVIAVITVSLVIDKNLENNFETAKS